MCTFHVAHNGTSLKEKNDVMYKNEYKTRLRDTMMVAICSYIYKKCTSLVTSLVYVILDQYFWHILNPKLRDAALLCEYR